MASGLRRRAAFALLELLVAMAILAVAIYAALRFFPAGLASIEHQRLITSATRLAQSEVEGWREGRAEPPFAVSLIKSGWPGTGVVLDRETSPFDVEAWFDRAAFDPTTKEGGLLVVREVFEVPPPDPSGNCKYVLSHGPPAWIPGTGAAVVAYNPQPLERADVQDPSQLGPNQYMVADWGSGRFVLQATGGQRAFKIDFTVSGGLDSVFDFIATLPANATEIAVDQPIVENSERLYQIYPASVNQWGVMTFTSPFAGRKVAVDYIVADPHIIGEELEIPPAPAGGGPVRLRLSITHLLDEPLSPMHPFSIAAVDLETGDVYTEGRGIVGADWRNSVVAFDPSLSGKRVKVYYKSADGIVLLPLKSPSLYVQYLPPDMNHPTGQMVVGMDPDGSMSRKGAFPRQFWFVAQLDPADDSLTLQFQPSEGGKVVAVDYAWSGGVTRGEIHPVPEGGPYEVTLLRRPVVLPLIAVRGVGLKARVCWLERNRVRKEDLDIVLPSEGAG